MSAKESLVERISSKEFDQRMADYEECVAPVLALAVSDFEMRASPIALLDTKTGELEFTMVPFGPESPSLNIGLLMNNMFKSFFPNKNLVIEP